MPEITMDGLTKDYGNKVLAADGLSLMIRDGEYMCILGPTGSGKTTCLRMICGLTHPDEGRVLFDGKDVTDMSVSERKATMLSQSYALFPPLTVTENITFPLKIAERDENESKRIVKSMMNLVHLGNKASSLPRELSGGQQQRTALARALASDSKVLLLDEPLRALDARLRLELRKDLKSLVKDMGLTAIHVTHDQDEALEMADRMAIIRNGRIVQIGTPMEVFKNPNSLFVANFLGRSNIVQGTLVESLEGNSQIRLSNGTMISTCRLDFETGSEVTLAIKIGSTSIDVAGSTKQNLCLEGTVERVLYEGANVTIDVNVEGIGRMTSKVSSKRYERYKAGDSVRIGWNPENASVFRLSPDELEEELRLD